MSRKRTQDTETTEAEPTEAEAEPSAEDKEIARLAELDAAIAECVDGLVQYAALRGRAEQLGDAEQTRRHNRSVEDHKIALRQLHALR